MAAAAARQPRPVATEAPSAEHVLAETSRTMQATPSAVASSPDSTGPETGSSSSSSGGGSFGLQWGDQLLNWASSLRVEAAAVARHVTQPLPPQGPPAQQQPQQASQQVQPPPQQLQAAAQLSVVQHEPPVQAPSTAAAQARPPSSSHGASSCAAMPPQEVALPGQPDHTQQPRPIDVAAWLSSAEADVPPPPEASAAGAAEPAAMSLVSAPFQQQGVGNAEQQQPDYVQADGDVAGAFRCTLCHVTISGQRNLQEHLGSRRHARRVATEAAAAAVAVAGPEPACGLDLAVTSVGGNASGTAAAGSGGGGGAGGGGARTYVGLGADVEPYVRQVISHELNAVAEAMLRRLLEWQERVRQADPQNFKRKRRVVSGLREVRRQGRASVPEGPRHAVCL